MPPSPLLKKAYIDIGMSNRHQFVFMCFEYDEDTFRNFSDVHWIRKGSKYLFVSCDIHWVSVQGRNFYGAGRSHKVSMHLICDEGSMTHREM